MLNELTNFNNKPSKALSAKGQLTPLIRMLCTTSASRKVETRPTTDRQRQNSAAATAAAAPYNADDDGSHRRPLHIAKHKSPTLAGVVVADFLDNVANERLIIDICLRCDFATQHDHTRFSYRFCKQSNC